MLLLPSGRALARTSKEFWDRLGIVGVGQLCLTPTVSPRVLHTGNPGAWEDPQGRSTEGFLWIGPREYRRQWGSTVGILPGFWDRLRLVGPAVGSRSTGPELAVERSGLLKPSGGRCHTSAFRCE